MRLSLHPEMVQTVVPVQVGMNALELDLATAVERNAAMTRTVALLRAQKGVTTPTPDVPYNPERLNAALEDLKKRQAI